MAEQRISSEGRQVVDITELAVLDEQFPLHLMQPDFRLMQVMDVAGRGEYCYVLSPFSEVPAGTVTYNLPGDDTEMPQAENYVPAFRIGTYPVTVAEYACAVQAGIVDEPRVSERTTWQRQLQQQDRPVVCVTWHEARAYAAWYATITQHPWRLPTADEWERASQGTNGRSFPWGNHTTPTSTEDRDTTIMMPVGSFRQDVSRYGVQDMVGLMYEWCSSTLSSYLQETHAGASDVCLALRCGVWGYTAAYRRMAFSRAAGLPPDAFSYDIGVRLVVNVVVGTS